MSEEALRAILEDFIADLTALLGEVKEEKAAEKDRFAPFFTEVRKSLFGGRLTKTQVSGMEAKIRACEAAAFPLSWAAYVLATSYHETAKRMQPVREGLNASDAWRKKNLRYYPWYGRGDVQLTWKHNYERADKELQLGGRLVENADLALDPEISARIIVEGMEKGWFTNRSLGDYLSTKEIATKDDFTKARRIVNGTDKDDLIAGYAMKFQDALLKMEY